MAFEWFIVFITALVSTRMTNKLKRARKNQKEGEFIPLDESETDSEDWEKTVEGAKEIAAKSSSASKGKGPVSGKAKTTPTAAEKGKAPMQPTSMKRKTIARKRGRSRGIEIEEPLASEPPPTAEGFVHINFERMKDFEKRECIGERHVNVAALRERSAAFGILFDKAQLAQICKFPETTGYCLHLIRTFYMCATQLQDHEAGPREFHTTVRNTKLTITPKLIGEVLGMSARAEGTNYMKVHVMTNAAWRTVVDGICISDTQSSGNSVFSKELRPEYRFLNFIVCYNILPNMQTKVLRWDRMLFLYFLGNPVASFGSNFNIPYLIWSRMARYVEHAHPTERLPFPLIIMRILRKFDVDIRSSTYMHSLGTINDSTIVKSLTSQPDETPTPPRSKRPSTSSRQATTATAAPATAATAQAASGPTLFETSDDDASVTSIYREQQGLSSEQKRLSIEQGRISLLDLQKISADLVVLKKEYNSMAKLVKKIFAKIGCSSSEDSDSG